MKNLLLSACCLLAVVSYAEALRPNTDRIMKAAEHLDAQAQADIWHACEDYDAAAAKLDELTSRLLPKPQKAEPKKKQQADPTIEAIRKQVNKTRNRFEFLKATINRWGPHTNVNARVASASLKDKLESARSYEKQLKDLQKAAKKDGKNLSKLRSDIEKYRDKAGTDSFRETCQRLLDILPVPNEG